MNERISQQMPQLDIGLMTGRGRRSGRPRHAVAADEAAGRPHDHRASAAAVQDDSRQSADSLGDMVRELNVRLQDMQRGLRFSVDDSSGRIIVKVIDLETEEVIRQIPSEEMLTIMRQAGESQSLIFNDEA